MSRNLIQSGVKMHEVQKRLLSLGSLVDLGSMSYRQIGERVSCKHASQVQHHIGQLIKNGYLSRKTDGSLVVSTKSPGLLQNNVLSIPVLGEADCGEATRFASDVIQGYLTLSPSTTKISTTKGVYSLVARGDSMNRANINGKTIEDGDYVLVEKRDPYVPDKNDYIVSIIDGMANIKKFQRDDAHQRVVLQSESHYPYPPIIIANEDFQHYQVAGKVVDVVKGTEHLV